MKKKIIMAVNYLLKEDDLVNNPMARVPVCLCLDTSGSMDGDPIDELNEGVKLFFNAIREDETAAYSAEIAIVTFGGSGAVGIQDFSTLQLQPEAPVLSASGMTPMGEAVNMALDMLERRKDEYKSKGVDYYQPWLVLMTDGAPNGSSSELNRSIERTCEAVNARKLTVFPIGIGPAADMDVLARYSPKRSPLKLRELKFREFFEWLSKSVSRTSQSRPGETVQLDINGIKGWGEL